MYTRVRAYMSFPPVLFLKLANLQLEVNLQWYGQYCCRVRLTCRLQWAVDGLFAPIEAYYAFKLSPVMGTVGQLLAFMLCKTPLLRV